MAQIFDRSSKRSPRQGQRPGQPVAFGHKHHVRALRLQCQSNFRDAARNLHSSFRILQYLAVPAALVACSMACIQLKIHPLIQTNDLHLTEILEPEHAHA
jgi:hypothetical protein